MHAALSLIFFIAGFFRAGITPVKTGPTTPAAIEQAGALVPNSALTPLISNISTNAAPAFGNWSNTIIPASLSAYTIPGAQLVGGIIQRFSASAATVDCTDTATNIINAIPGAVPNQTFRFEYANLGSQPVTLAPGVQVTMLGTNVIGGLTARLFLGQVMGSGAGGSGTVQISGLYAFGLQSGL